MCHGTDLSRQPNSNIDSLRVFNIGKPWAEDAEKWEQTCHRKVKNEKSGPEPCGVGPKSNILGPIREFINLSRTIGLNEFQRLITTV